MGWAGGVVVACGSLVVSPQGEIVAGLAEGERLLCAEQNLDDIPRGKFDLDVAGHCNGRMCSLSIPDKGYLSHYMRIKAVTLLPESRAFEPQSDYNHI